MVLSSRGDNRLSETELCGNCFFIVSSKCNLFIISKFYSQGGLFQSPHEDENDVQTISHKCKVLPFDQYTERHGPDPKQYESVYDNNDTFYLAGHYDPTSIVLTLENHIPSKASDKKNGKDTK